MKSLEPSPELQAYLLEHQNDLVAHIIQFNELMSRYKAAVKEITTKLEILKNDIQFRSHRNSIESIQSRIKKPVSILKKLNSRGIEVNLDTIRRELNDVAGIRVVCPFIDDIYLVADKLATQDDIRVVEVKDYIKKPKPNGYRSYHMIIEVPVFFMEAKELMRVEVQLRTVAMDFWASLEHEIKYKKDMADAKQLVNDLKACADTIAETDRRMLELRERMSGQSDADNSFIKAVR